MGWASEFCRFEEMGSEGYAALSWCPITVLPLSEKYSLHLEHCHCVLGQHCSETGLVKQFHIFSLRSLAPGG
jgi:hypothetical protein